MIRLYYKERLKHAIRFRTRRGFGVHPPYMFNLIIKVLRDKKSNNYIYPQYIYTSKSEKKIFRLTLRLINHIAPKTLFAYGIRSERLKNYIKDIKITTSPKEIATCKMLWLDYFPNLTNTMQTAIVDWCRDYEGYHAILVTDINKVPQQRKLWLLLASEARIRVEMMWCGLLIFDKKLQPGQYHMLP